MQLVAAAHEQPLVEVHEEAHLVERAAPVLGRERVHGEPLEAELERALDRVEQRLLARGVPVGALEAPLLRPPAVAVHHHRHVRGDPIGVDARQVAAVRKPGRGSTVCKLSPAGYRVVVGDRLNRLRQRWRWFDVVMAVKDRFDELEGGVVAAAVTLSIFVSLFPALLVGTAIVGYIANGSVDLASDVIDRLGLSGTAADVMTEAISSAEKSRRAASIIGFVGFVWSALGVVMAIQLAVDKAWQVKGGGIKQRGKAAVWLLVIGALLAASIALTGFIVGVLPGWAAPIVIVPTVAVNVGVFWFTFVMLGSQNIGWRPLLPGAVLAGSACRRSRSPAPTSCLAPSRTRPRCTGRSASCSRSSHGCSSSAGCSCTRRSSTSCSTSATVARSPSTSRRHAFRARSPVEADRGGVVVERAESKIG